MSHNLGLKSKPYCPEKKQWVLLVSVLQDGVAQTLRV
jgi:hypothetical protein